jgi:hypothetical protein
LVVHHFQWESMSKKPSIKFPYKKIKGILNWYDANSKTGWIDSKEFKELTPSICHTQGWIFEVLIVLILKITLLSLVRYFVFQKFG